MKKLICVLLIVCLMPVCALAEMDFSKIPYETLVELQKQIALEIMSRPEWKEVVVPSGTWIVGVDIPAGFYSIHPTSIGGYVTIKKGSKTIVSQGIRSEEQAFGKIELKEGYVVEVENGSVIFAPPKGLGF